MQVLEEERAGQAGAASSERTFESNNLTYSESGFNPAGSLRYTMLGASSNLCGSIYNGVQSSSTAGGA